MNSQGQSNNHLSDINSQGQSNNQLSGMNGQGQSNNQLSGMNNAETPQAFAPSHVTGISRLSFDSTSLSHLLFFRQPVAMSVLHPPLSLSLCLST